MGEQNLAELVNRELVEFDRKKILVRNSARPEKVINLLGIMLTNTRFLFLDCTDEKSFRKSLFSYFIGDGLPNIETAFEAGWRSHATEISLVSETSGYEIIAGLQSDKARIKMYLLNEQKFLDKNTLYKICSSFLWSLPTIICFLNYTEKKQPFPLNTYTMMPRMIVFRNDSGSLSGADAVIESGMMSIDSIRNYLVEQKSKVSLEKVVSVCSGDEGLVKLFVGLHEFIGENSDDVFTGLNVFLDSNPQFAEYAKAAAVFGMQFLPREVCLFTGIESQKAYLLGQTVNLWKGVFVGTFLNTKVREFILSRIPSSEKGELLSKAANCVLQFRGRNSRSYEISADIQVRATLFAVASESYKKAGDLSTQDLRKATLYKKAAVFTQHDSDKLTFKAAYNLYKAELYPEAVKLLKTIKGSSDSNVELLKGLCSVSETSWLDLSICNLECGIFAGISREILESRYLSRKGYYHKAERILLKKAVNSDSLNSTVCLVELGEQLYKRGMVEHSMNTMVAAKREAVKLKEDWLERKALFTLAKAWNSLGKQNRIELNLSRLIQLTLLCGNRRKLVFVYNLYANSLLLRSFYKKALEIYSLTLGILVTIPDSQGVRIVVLNNMGVSQRRLNQTSESLRTFMRQVRVCVSSGNFFQACTSYGNMARIFIHLCKIESAEDCLETMVEFASLGNILEAKESICYISSQIAFMKGDNELALSLIDQSIQLSLHAGKKRRLSLGLVKKGSMLLRLSRYEDAIGTLTKAFDISSELRMEVNHFSADMRCSVAKCYLGLNPAVDLLDIKNRGSIDYAHRGEQFYYHWLLTGSRQSMTAAAQLLSSDLSHGLYFHSYLYMLQEIKQEIPSTLADAIPLLHNYPSCD